MLQAQRGDRQHQNAICVDHERVLVGAMGRTAILDHAQEPRGGLRADAMVEHDHAVGDIFLHTIARQRLFAVFAGDDGGDALLLQPAKQAAQFGAQDELVGEAGEQRLDGIQRHALGADGVDGGPQANEQAFQVVFAVCSISLRSI